MGGGLGAVLGLMDWVQCWALQQVDVHLPFKVIVHVSQMDKGLEYGGWTGPVLDKGTKVFHIGVDCFQCWALQQIDDHVPFKVTVHVSQRYEGLVEGK